MKKAVVPLLAAALALTLAGCATPDPPAQAEDGTAWSEDWVTVGGVIGVDTPQGMTPQENNEALAANGMYYATWSMGESAPYVNADGEDALIYDAQAFLLLAGYTSEEEARQTAADWLELAKGQYQISETETRTYNGQEYTVITYDFASDTNPYARGASAFTVSRNFAVSVEFSCLETFDGDAPALLADFLENCHYGT